MTTENSLKKQKPVAEITPNKSKGVNIFLWLLVLLLVAFIAGANIYYQDTIDTPIRVIAIIVGLLIATGIAFTTNQGKRAFVFFKESKVELRRITWPTFAETKQTTLIVLVFTLLMSLLLWGFDSIIILGIQFLTNLRF